MSVRFWEPGKEFARIETEVMATMRDVLSRGDLIMRGQLRAYEEHLAAFVGTRFAVGVSSGYHALYLSLKAAGIGPGDEVITVAHTFVATISAIVHTGATPVLVDVGKDYNMDVDAVEQAITPHTRAILPVHLNGRMCDMDRLMAIAGRHEILVIEDAAQAVGATYRARRAGSFGLAGCFSHYPFKILGAFGDGGAVTTEDPEIARKVTLLRYNGEDRQTGEYHYHGYTALLDNVQAAVLDVKLKHLPEWIEWRRHIAARYRDALADVSNVSLPQFEGDQYNDVYQNYVIRTARRDQLRSYLRERGVETLTHWPKPVWEHRQLQLGDWHLPETERICREVLSLPMSAETTEEHADYTAQCIREFFA